MDDRERRIRAAGEAIGFCEGYVRGAFDSALKTAAARRWPGYDIRSDGRYASVSHCRAQVACLHQTLDEAEQAMAFIDKLACGGGCRRQHEIVDLYPAAEKIIIEEKR